MFLLSYLPLFIIYAINNIIVGNYIVSWIFVLVIIVVCLLSLLLFRAVKRKGRKRKINILRYQTVNHRLIEYIFVYIFPFLGSFGGIELISFLILFVVIGSIYIKSDLIAINPILSLFGYSIYDIEYFFYENKEKFLQGFLLAKDIEEEGEIVEAEERIFIKFKKGRGINVAKQ